MSLAAGLALGGHICVLVATHGSETPVEEPLETVTLDAVLWEEKAPEASDERQAATSPKISANQKSAGSVTHRSAQISPASTLPADAAITATSGEEDFSLAAIDGWSELGRSQLGRGTLRRGLHRSTSINSGTFESQARGARLVPRTASCADLYPVTAERSTAHATVSLRIEKDGHARFLNLQTSSHHETTLEQAARLCTERLRFIPARDESGQVRSALATVRLTFRSAA